MEVAWSRDKDVIVILRIRTSKSVGETTQYYIGKKSQEAYYSTDGQEFAGYWGGKGAEMLGLRGRVTDEAFARLANNLHPFTGEQLTPRMRADRRPGFDVNFNVPKPVSLVYARTRDERIIWALRQAQFDTLLEMQEEAATRDRENGRKDGDKKTGVLVWAEIIHLTARPEKNGIPDPHLHSHCYVFNVTVDPDSKQWKALQFGRIHEEADYYNWAVTHRLAENLKMLGLDIVPTKDAFDIAGISRELIEKFSNRTKTIEEEAIKRGITDPDEKAKLGALTRKRKTKSLLISELEPYWWGSLTPEEAQALDRIGEVLKRSRAKELVERFAGERLERDQGRSVAEPGESKLALGQKGTDWVKSQAGDGSRVSMNRATRPSPTINREARVTDHERRAVALAIEHIFERRSVVTEKQLEAEALKSFCVGKASFWGIKQVVAAAPLLRVERDGITLVTTREVLAEEKRLVAECIQGKDRFEPMNKLWQIEDERLNAQQRNAVTHVLNSRDWITGIAGRAGVGKTTLLNELRHGIEAGFNKLIALAPTSQAARDVLRQEGFANAETVAKLLTSERLQREARDAVWLVDEAGLLPTRQTDKLFQLAKKLNSRVVMVADIGQHHPVERGQAFELLQNAGRMSVVDVTEIQRQTGVYKRFVEHVRAGDMERAFMSLDVMDAIFEMTLAERRVALAKDYISAIERGETALVVSPTHVECHDVTDGIREALKERKKLKGAVEWDVLRDLSWTQAQKSDSDHYKDKHGLVVQINGHVKGFALGEQVEVLYESSRRKRGRDDGMVRVRRKNYDSNLNIRALPLDRPDTFSVYEAGKMEICEGERVRVTCNSRTAEGRQLSNGKEYTVDYFSHDGKLVLENGWKVDRKFKHLEYGYAETPQSVQGKTVDWVFLAETAQLSSCASDLRAFYVGTSRGRKGVKVYTDSIELLKENVSERRERPMAMEILPDVPLSQRLGQEHEAPEGAGKIAAEMGLENGVDSERNASESLGKSDGGELAAVIEAELREIIAERKDRELEREREREMDTAMEM